MAYDFTEPVSIGNGVKQEFVKIVKLVGTDFATTGPARPKEALPADATITEIRYWKKTAFSGNGVTAVSLNIINSASGVAYVGGLDLHTPAAGAQAVAPVVTNIMQQNDGNRQDIPLNFVCNSTTGNPTAGEVYIIIKYVR